MRENKAEFYQWYRITGLFWLILSIFCFIPRFAYIGNVPEWISQIHWYHRLPIIVNGLLSLFNSILLVRTEWIDRIERFWKQSGQFLKRTYLIVLAGIFGIGAYAFVYFLPGSKFLPYFSPLLLILVAFLTIQFCLRSMYEKLDPWWATMLGVILVGFYQKILSSVGQVNASPFSLSWSESGRLFDATLFYSRLVYGYQTSLPILDPGRALLSGLPHLIPGLPLVVHRFWLELLWWLGQAGFAWVLVKRLKIDSRVVAVGLIAWFTLYLYQGPVFFHLILGAIIVAAGYDRDRFVKSLVIVLIASIWEGICRINWFPLPGFLAAIFYFLETPMGHNKWHSYFRKPVIFALGGTLTSVLTYGAYVLLSGNPREWFGSSFSSQLFWYRFFPNSNSLLGIIPWIILVSLPLWIMTGKYLLKGNSYRGWRKLAIIGILLMFFTGGLLVSLKIGGGNNLHNLDGYILLMGVVTLYLWGGRGIPDIKPVEKSIREFAFRGYFVAILLILIPVIPVLCERLPHPNTQPEKNQIALQEISQIVEEKKDDGEVLFISERQLQIFSDLNYGKLVEPYETVFLMEMVMGNNQSYLQQFDTDLKNHRFSLIVLGTINLEKQGANVPFGEENDVWANEVGIPVLEYYQEYSRIPDIGLSLYVPKE